MIEVLGFDIPLWILSGLGFVIAAGSFNTVQKWVVADESPIDVAYHTNLIAGIFLIPFPLMLANSLSFSPISVILVCVTGVVNAISFYLFATSLKLEDLGVIAPTRGVIPIMTAIVEPVVFTELGFHPQFIIAGILASVGLYVVATKGSFLEPMEHLTSKGFLFGVASSLTIVVATLVDRMALSTSTTPILYSMSMAFTTAVTLCGIRLLTKDRLPNLIPSSPKLIVAGGTRAMTLGFAIFTLSLATSTQFNIIAQLGIPLSITIGWFVFNETGYFARRMVGTSLIILGVVLVL